MKITTAHKGLKWAYHAYAEISDDKHRVEIYLHIRLLDTYQKHHPAATHVSGMLEESLQLVLGVAVEKFTHGSAARISTRDLPGIAPLSAAVDLRLMHSQLSELVDVEGDQDWVNVTGILADEILPPPEPQRPSSSSSAAVHLVQARNPNDYQGNVEGFSKFLLAHVYQMNEHLSVQLHFKQQQKSTMMHEKHTECIVLGAMFHAILVEMLRKDPGLKEQPAQDLPVYKSIMRHIEKMQCLAASRNAVVNNDFPPIPPIHEGPSTPMDGGVMQNLRFFISTSQGFEHIPGVQQAKDAAGRVLAKIVERNAIHGYASAVYRRKQ